MTAPSASPTADVALYFDPVCPFCWVTSKWLRQVARLRGLEVEWKFISLAILNEGEGAYDDRPELYPAVHGLGRELLRVAAAVRDAHGPEPIGPLYEAFGDALWETPAPGGVEDFGDVLAQQSRGVDVGPILVALGLPVELAEARSDERWDAVLRAETEEALSRTGRDVGTPIIALRDGPALFGPVISDLPSDEDAVRYWDAFTTLAEMPGFAEVKRSLRSIPVTALTAPLAGAQTTAS